MAGELFPKFDPSPRERGVLAGLADRWATNPYPIGEDGYYESAEYGEWRQGFAVGQRLLNLSKEEAPATLRVMNGGGQHERGGCFRGDAVSDLYSAHPEVRGFGAENLGRPGIVTVWDDEGRFVGCMGIELWKMLLSVTNQRLAAVSEETR